MSIAIWDVFKSRGWRERTGREGEVTKGPQNTCRAFTLASFTRKSSLPLGLRQGVDSMAGQFEVPDPTLAGVLFSRHQSNESPAPDFLPQGYSVERSW